MFDPVFTRKFGKFVGGKLWSIIRYHFLRQAVLGKYETSLTDSMCCGS